MVRAAVDAIALASYSFDGLSPDDRALKLCSESLQHVWERSFAALGDDDPSKQSFKSMMGDVPGVVAQSLSEGSVRISSQNSGARSQALRVPSLTERKGSLRRDICRFEEETRHWADLDASISDATHACADENEELQRQPGNGSTQPDVTATASVCKASGQLIKTQSLQKAMLQVRAAVLTAPSWDSR